MLGITVREWLRRRDLPGGINGSPGSGRLNSAMQQSGQLSCGLQPSSAGSTPTHLQR